MSNISLIIKIETRLEMENKGQGTAEYNQSTLIEDAKPECTNHSPKSSTKQVTDKKHLVFPNEVYFFIYPIPMYVCMVACAI